MSRSKLAKWQKIVISLVFFLTLVTYIANFSRYNMSLVDPIAGLSLNTIIIYVIFKASNLIFRRKKGNSNESNHDNLS